uniref:Uncharacterized protein n=1 Tax=Setaria italica TaxID=4555 RepID=K3YEF7_SETIT
MAIEIAPWAIKAIDTLLHRHGLRDRDECAMCAQEVETMDHLLTSCVHIREAWFRILRFFGLQCLLPQVEAPFAEWWIQERKRVAKTQRKDFDSLVWLVAWSFWKEWDIQMHERTTLQPVALTSVVLWKRGLEVGLAS